MFLTPPAGHDLPLIRTALHAHTVQGTSQETTVGFASVSCLGNFRAAPPVPSLRFDVV